MPAPTNNNYSDLVFLSLKMHLKISLTNGPQ